VARIDETRSQLVHGSGFHAGSGFASSMMWGVEPPLERMAWRFPMLPKPIGLPAGLPMNRLVRELERRGVAPNDARAEAARLIRVLSEAEAHDAVERITGSLSLGF